MSPKKIVIDGKVYNSLDEMPEDVRRNYERALRNTDSAVLNDNPSIQDGLKTIFADNDKDGLPDIIQNAQSINLMGGTTITADGKTYNSLDDLPPEYRERYEQAMASMDKNRNGVPDFLEGMINAASASPQSSSNIGNYKRESLQHSRPAPVQSVITPDTSRGWTLAIAGLLLLFLCVVGAAGVWYFFLR